MTAKKIQKTVVAIATFVSGLYFFLDFILPQKIFDFEFGKYTSEVSQAAIIIGVMAVGLGIINLLRIHGLRIVKGKKGWGNSLALLLGMLIVFVAEGGDFANSLARQRELENITRLELFAEKIKSDALVRNVPAQITAANISLLGKELKTLPTSINGQNKYVKGVSGDSLSKAAKITLEKFTALETSYANLSDIEMAHSQFISQIKLLQANAREIAEINYQQKPSRIVGDFISESFYIPLGSAMFSLLAFYIVTAAYRTFRLRSIEAVLMMSAAIIVMLGQIPLGPLYISESLPALRLWLIENVSNPSFRAIFFGSSIAGLIAGIRMWFSLEVSPLVSDSEGTHG